MENPFNLSKEKLLELMTNYVSWLNSNPQEAKYPVEFRTQADTIRDEFLINDVITNMPDDILYEKIYRYSRSLEGPAYIRLGEMRIRDGLLEIRRNLKYIISSEETPFMIAQNVLEGEYRIEVFAKAFWSPILHARFPGILPNWNNKTERLLKKLGVNLSTSKLFISQKYKILSNSFKFLSALAEDQDFFNINHLMHYGTEIREGIDLIERLQSVDSLKNSSMVSAAVQNIIRTYKEHIRQTKLNGELYKWELLNKYKGRPNIKAEDFASEILGIDFSNWMYPMAISVRNHIVNELPSDCRNCFIKSFNE